MYIISVPECSTELPSIDHAVYPFFEEPPFLNGDIIRAMCMDGYVLEDESYIQDLYCKDGVWKPSGNFTEFEECKGNTC